MRVSRYLRHPAGGFPRKFPPPRSKSREVIGMKKIIAALLLMSLLAGCGMQPSDPESLRTFSDPETTQEYTAAEPAPSPLAEMPAEVLLWARQTLSPQAQETYDLLDAAIACHQETPVEMTSTAEDVQLALTALSMDRPEYFWFDGQASYVTTTMPVLGERISVTLSYTMTRQEAEDAMSLVEQYVNDCFFSPEMAAAQSDYDRIIAVYRYIINNTDYVLSEQDQSFLSVMTDGQGTCAGYARCFQYLMHRLDIPCTLALGYGQGGDHGWNVVSCGGQWYHVDVTWGDPVDASGAPGNSLEYTYCMLTDEQIYRTHTADPDIPLPECTATEYNYFRRAGLQMGAWDVTAYEGLMLSAVSRGESWFTVRFDQQEDYQAAMNTLIDSSGIMTVLSNCGVEIPPDGVTYSYDDVFYEFSVKISY